MRLFCSGPFVCKWILSGYVRWVAPAPSLRHERSFSVLLTFDFDRQSGSKSGRVGSRKTTVRKMQNAKSVCTELFVALLLAIVPLTAQQTSPRVQPVQPASS